MDLEDDEDLLENDDGALEEDADTPLETSPGSLNARRLIERRLELRRLREQLDDPDFEDLIE